MCKIYSYEVCYFDKICEKIKRKMLTNSYSSAVWEIEYYKKHLPDKNEWFIKPVTSKLKNKLLWKGCPF